MKTNNIIVRPTVEADFSQIIGMVDEIAQTAPGKRAQFNWNASQIQDELLKSRSWVAVKDQLVQAFVSTRETADFFEITVLATKVSSRNQGFQSELMRTIITEAGRLKKNVFLEVHEENLSAINFYRKLGFKELPPRKSYYSDGKNALVFIFEVYPESK